MQQQIGSTLSADRRALQSAVPLLAPAKHPQAVWRRPLGAMTISRARAGSAIEPTFSQALSSSPGGCVVLCKKENCAGSEIRFPPPEVLAAG